MSSTPEKAQRVFFRLEGDVSRCERHINRIAPKAQTLLGECVPTDLTELNDLSERCKQCYEQLESLNDHFDHSFQQYQAAYDDLDDPTQQDQNTFERHADFNLERPVLLNNLRIRIDRMNEAQVTGANATLQGASGGSSMHTPSDSGQRGASDYRTTWQEGLPWGKGDKTQPSPMVFGARQVEQGGGPLQMNATSSTNVGPGRSLGSPVAEPSCIATLTAGQVVPNLPPLPFPPPTTSNAACFTVPSPLAPLVVSSLAQQGPVYDRVINDGPLDLSLRMRTPTTTKRPFQDAGMVEGSTSYATGGDQMSRDNLQAGLQDSGPTMADLVTMLSQALNRNSDQPRTSNVRLPKVNLPKFDGKYSEWQPFWDKFGRVVDANSQISDADKFSYLVSCLEDRAAALVHNLRITNENYAKAVQILQKAFGNPVIAIEAIQSKIYDIKPVLRYDVPKLKEFFYELENIVGSLEALNADTTNYVGLLLKKLPIGIVTAMERTKGIEQSWSMDLFRRLFKQELDIREAAQRRSGNRYASEPMKTSSRGYASTTDAFASSELKATTVKNSQGGAFGKERRVFYGSGAASTPKTPCVYCDGRHWCNDCPKLTNVNDRRDFLRQTRRCFVCLARGHTIKECEHDRPCFYCQKAKSHHSSLCYEQPRHTDVWSGVQNNRKDDGSQSTDLIDLSVPEEHSALADDEYTLMKTALIKVCHPQDPSKSKIVRAFLDTGTSRSFMTERIAKDLGLQIDSHRILSIKRYGPDNEAPLMDEVKTAKVDLQSADRRSTFRINIAISKNAMTKMTKRGIPTSVLRNVPRDVKLADKPLPVNQTVDVDFMIGNDHYDDFVVGNKIYLQSGLWLVESCFGWLISGRVADDHNPTELEHVCKAIVEPTRVIDEIAELDSGIPTTIEQLWKLEAIGITDEPNPTSDDSAISKFNKTVEARGERYYVAWPVKPNIAGLPTNYHVALKRLRSMIARQKRLGRWEYLERYDSIMKDQLQKNILEYAPKKPDGQVHYVPHHGVETPQKATTKLRVVYDASARSKHEAPSLNDCLYRGQQFMESILILLMRFRCHTVVIVSDIEKAFLQVGLQESQRDLARLLWVKDYRKPPDETNIITLRFQRVPFGMKASPFLLGATIAHHLKQIGTETAAKIANNCYVDNVITGTDSLPEAKTFYHESKRLFKAAGMNLREYASNAKELMDDIPLADRVQGNELKVLRTPWNFAKDELIFRKPALAEGVATKRSVLSELYKLFDPLGMLCPVTIRGKILLQEITKARYHWSAPLPQGVGKLLEAIKQDLNCVDQIRIPRFVGKTLSGTRLIVFCDASKSAYACVVYLQVPNDNGTFDSNLIMAKTRVTPIKGMSIPRLELLAMTIAVKAAHFARSSLNLNGRVVIFSDSQCVLQWICSRKVQSTFVENRLKEIRKFRGYEYRYTPTNENPADKPSRGCSIQQLDHLWWHGPNWAMKDDSLWPMHDFVTGSDSEECEMVTDDAVSTAPAAPFLLDLNLTSSYDSAIRVVAWCLRFIDKCGRQSREAAKHPTPNEVKRAENVLFRHAQRSEYKDLMNAIARKAKHPLKGQLGVIMDDKGILRCSTRLCNIHAADDTKFPVLLPSKGRLIQLIIEDRHRKSFHAGVAQTLAAIRRQFWLPRGRSRVSSAVHRCEHCRKYDSVGYARPHMPNLPKARVVQSRPFSHVGLDNLGPLYVKQSCQTTSKRWVTLFTCLTVRAVHLEIVQDQSASEFLMALRRFVAHHGKPSSIVCDNASQFRAVKAADPVSEFLAGQRIQWNFIPQLAPWAGGVYERLVKIVKSSLQRSVGRRLLSDQQLQTIIAEVKQVVNSRPLTYQTGDPKDVLALSPNDFLAIPSTGTENLDDHIEDYHEGRVSAADGLRTLFRRDQAVLNEFWRIWHSDYLLSLREQLRWAHRDRRGVTRKAPKKDDVVLIRDPMLPRSRWRYGRILNVIQGSDGAIRAAQVLLANRNTIVRPVSLLCPLECDLESKVRDAHPTDANRSPNNQRGVKQNNDRNDLGHIDPNGMPHVDQKNRPRRAAAREAQKRIQTIFAESDSDEE